MSIKTRDNELNYQKILSLTLSFMLFFSPIALFVNVLLIVIFWTNVSFDSMILYGLLFAMCLWSLGIVLKRIKLTTLLIPMFLLLAYVCSYTLYPETRQYMFTSFTDLVENKAYWLFIYSLPAFLFIRRIWNYEILLKYLLNFALVSLLCSFGTLVIYLSQDSQPGYMNFSYDLLLTTVLLLYGFFTKRKRHYLFGGIAGGGMMFFCGARGPMLCLMFAVILYVLFMSEKQSTKILATVGILAAALIILVFWEPVLTLLFNLAKSLGISSRILEKMVDGTLTDDSGRGTVRSELVPVLNILGHGLYGDRVVTGGRYAHNLFLELAIQFGLLMGTFLIVFLLLLLFSGMFTKDREKRLLFLAFFCSSFIKLMMSSSYLSKEPAFYCMLGICVSCYFTDDKKPEARKKSSHFTPLADKKRR